MLDFIVEVGKIAFNSIDKSIEDEESSGGDALEFIENEDHQVHYLVA